MGKNCFNVEACLWVRIEHVRKQIQEIVVGCDLREIRRERLQ